ncbi:unnamed protein product [Amoebophrya sp. A25]|nr:unnamed protein product [Amoebophrya sp. A25]|eukprot:GSA25T00025911001.1
MAKSEARRATSTTAVARKGSASRGRRLKSRKRDVEDRDKRGSRSRERSAGRTAGQRCTSRPSLRRRPELSRQ